MWMLASLPKDCLLPLQLPCLESLLLALLQLGLWLLALAASAQLLRLGSWALRTPLQSLPVLPDFRDDKLLDLAAYPPVTVQLPMRNERFVAGRAITAACALHWPQQRLQVQVLDDSDDDTMAVVDQTTAALRARGYTIEVVRRKTRDSFKAGHLDYALPTATGDFIAVLDADFVPPPDFLRHLLPALLGDSKLAFVQGRWSFLNERANLLTRVQALILHGLMLVEQAYLSALGRPVQFNGTGGVWRKQALLDAGGWVGKGEPGQAHAASVTEDLDLSYRIHLLGYRGRHLPQVAVPTELPESMAAFRSQQQRWVRGGAQVLRTLLGKLREGRLTAAEKRTMLGHLLRHVRQPYLLLSLLWLPLLPLGLLTPAFAPPGGLLAAVLLLHLSLSIYYGAALRRLGRSPLGAVLLSPLVVGLSMGLSVSLTVALWRGIWAGRTAAEFVRTPKTGDQPPAPSPDALAALTPTPRARPAGYRPVRDALAQLELGLGVIYLVLCALLIKKGLILSALGLGGLVGAGLLWVGLGSLRIGKSP